MAPADFILNTIYKLVSGCIAERIKPNLDTIINNDQKGFVSGRYIGEAVRTTFDIMQYAKTKKKVGVILLIDFEKAYDSLSFSYVEKCLTFFNFGSCMINWINLLLNNFSAVINHCGNISEKFQIGRGARQGDPLASYLFIICIEILAHKLRNHEKIKGFRIENTPHTLELYADDCTIFLEPTEESLKTAVEALNNFFTLSGLKISVSKTKAIWFGEGSSYTHKLCPDLTLDWDTKFRLLGIDFTNNLEGMENNFHCKLEEISTLFNCWFHRTLTIYGRSVIIKSLALPKLTHLALVLPDLGASKIKLLESLCFSFLWGNKPDKVKREVAKLPEKAGGLGIVDIRRFWISLKLSWLRRAIHTDAFWPKILQEEIRQLTNQNLNICDLLQLGPSKLTFIGKKLDNKFWNQVLCSVTPFMQGALYCYPEKLFEAPIWDNRNILRNNKPIKKSAFPTISAKINTISELCIPGTGNLYNKAELENNLELVVSDEDWTELKYIIKLANRSLGIQDDHQFTNFLPRQPLLIELLNLTKKGCNVYNRILSKKNNLERALSVTETKWNQELNCILSPDFWNKTYCLASSIKNDNRMKWLQYQINRNCLFTNYRVHKFKPHISPDCDYCSNAQNIVSHPELVSHLFYDCIFVQTFWQQIRDWLVTLGINFSQNRDKLLFGDHDHPSNSIVNFTALCGKYYIWRTKFQSKQLSLLHFQEFLKDKLVDLKNACLYEDKEDKFEEWRLIFYCVVRITCTDTSNEAPLPVNTQEDQVPALVPPL